VRYGTELVSFTQNEAGVTAIVRERAAGNTSEVRADYLIAADGSHSRIREALGIPTQGLGELPESQIFVYFRADWGELIQGYEADAILTIMGFSLPQVAGFEPLRLGGCGFSPCLLTLESKSAILSLKLVIYTWWCPAGTWRFVQFTCPGSFSDCSTSLDFLRGHEVPKMRLAHHIRVEICSRQGWFCPLPFLFLNLLHILFSPIKHLHNNRS
jgi:hypothetical protein